MTTMLTVKGIDACKQRDGRGRKGSGCVNKALQLLVAF